MLRQPWRFYQMQDVIDKAMEAEQGQNQAEVPSHDVLTKLPLLDAYINESLRLNPPLPFAIQREVPPEGAMIGDYHIPGGVQGRLAIYSIHRDSRYFKDPEQVCQLSMHGLFSDIIRMSYSQFQPERWLSDDDVQCDKSAFTPLCVIKNFYFQPAWSHFSRVLFNSTYG